MENKNGVPKDNKQVKKATTKEEKTEKEFDADNEAHKTSPDLIQKEDHHLPVDDEVKKG